jgi:hypothetical protein
VKFRRKKKLAPAQVTKARKLIEHGERVEDVAALWNVGRTTLYRALAGCAQIDLYVALSEKDRNRLP